MCFYHVKGHLLQCKTIAFAVCWKCLYWLSACYATGNFALYTTGRQMFSCIARKRRLPKPMCQQYGDFTDIMLLRLLSQPRIISCDHRLCFYDHRFRRLNRLFSTTNLTNYTNLGCAVKLRPQFALIKQIIFDYKFDELYELGLRGEWITFNI